LQLALKNNLSLKTAFNDEKIASYQYKASYGKFLPNVYGEAENRNSWGREIDQNTNEFVNQDLKIYSGRANAVFNLFSGFSAINTVKSTKEELKIQRINIKKVENEISIDLAQKFITILYLQEIIVANKEQIQSSEKQLELAILKFNAGVVAESEVFKIKTQKAREELNLLTNENRLIDNLISLKQLMNIPLEKEITVLSPTTDIRKNNLLDENPYSLTKKAIEINPRYNLSLLREKKARTNLSLARSSLYPTLSLRFLAGSNYTDNYFDDGVSISNEDQIDLNYSRGLRLNLIIPIFSQMTTYSKIKTSKMNFKQSRIDSEIIQNNLSKEVLKAIADTKTSIKKNEASTLGFEFSRKSYEADALKFELGKININELNVTKLAYNNAQAELIQSKYELLFNNALINFYLGDEFKL
jgi:outer membrane protein